MKKTSKSMGSVLRKSQKLSASGQSQNSSPSKETSRRKKNASQSGVTSGTDKDACEAQSPLGEKRSGSSLADTLRAIGKRSEEEQKQGGDGFVNPTGDEFKVIQESASNTLKRVGRPSVPTGERKRSRTVAISDNDYSEIKTIAEANRIAPGDVVVALLRIAKDRKIDLSKLEQA